MILENKSDKNDVYVAAMDKLNDPKQHQGKSSNKAQAVFPFVIKALAEFCYQDTAFAEAVLKQKETVGACCEKICQNIGNHISDIDLYKKVVAFYFPGATVELQMKISTNTSSPVEEEAPRAVVLNLFDML